MDNEALIDNVQSMAPWHHRLKLRDGVFTESKKTNDLTKTVVHLVDPHQSFHFAIKHVLPNGMEGRSFLDCACNCGGHSFAAKDAGASRTHGFDVRDHWINQAKFVAKNREADSTGMTFEVADLMQIEGGGQDFDVTWFSGIFYHLPDPVTGLKYAADRTKELLFLNTSCSAYVPGEPENPALHYKKEGVEQLMSGVYGLSWLPSGPRVLKDILNWLGFPETRIYYWVSKPPNDTTQNPMSRIGIVAAREPGRLDALPHLSQPSDLDHPSRPARQVRANPQNRTVAAEAPAEMRPLRWEDDISTKALDTLPFDNVTPIATWEESKFRAIPAGKVPQNLKSLRLRELVAKDNIPIPDASDREAYNLGHDENYWLSGLSDYHNVLDAAAKRNVKVDRILDIGCASGRVLRHFACQRDTPEIWGTDINGRHIRWMSEFMPSNVRPVFLPSLPNMPFEDNYFDVVTAFSVFTHIDTFESAFLAEIRRILRPGGLGYLTAHTEPTWEAWGKEAAVPDSSLANKVAKFPDLREDLRHPMTQGFQAYRHKEVGPYRSLAFHKASYIQSTWGRYLNIEEIIPMQHNLQTCIIVSI